MPRPPHRRPRTAKRKPPQEITGDERRFFNSTLKAHERLTVELTDGSRWSGVLRSFTDETLEIDTDEQSQVRFAKSLIRYVESEN